MIRTFMFWNVVSWFAATVTELTMPNSPWVIVPVLAQLAFLAGLMIGTYLIGRRVASGGR